MFFTDCCNVFYLYLFSLFLCIFYLLVVFFFLFFFFFFFFFFQAEDGIRDLTVTGVQTCALPILDGGDTGRRDRPRRRLQAARNGPPARGASAGGAPGLRRGLAGRPGSGRLPPLDRPGSAGRRDGDRKSVV